MSYADLYFPWKKAYNQLFNYKYLSTAVYSWCELNKAEQRVWNKGIRNEEISGFNLYCRQFLKEIKKDGQSVSMADMENN